MPEEEKSRRLTILQEKQRAIQIRKNTALIGTQQEVLVEGYNSSTGQWIGRTSQNRTLNFVTAEQAEKARMIGRPCGGERWPGAAGGRGAIPGVRKGRRSMEVEMKIRGRR